MPNRGPRGGPYGEPRWVSRGSFYFQGEHQDPGHQDNLNAYGYPAQGNPNPNWGMRGDYGGWPVRGTLVENPHQQGNPNPNWGMRGGYGGWPVRGTLVENPHQQGNPNPNWGMRGGYGAWPVRGILVENPHQQGNPNPNWGMRGGYGGWPVRGTLVENLHQQGNPNPNWGMRGGYGGGPVRGTLVENPHQQGNSNPNWGMRGGYGGMPVSGTWVENAPQQGIVYGSRGRGHNGRHDGPAYLENLEESGENLGPYGRLHFDDQIFTQHYLSEQIRQHHNDQFPGRGRCGYRGTRPPKSMSSVPTNQGDKEPFEQNKLVLSGLNGSTTEKGVLIFIEAISGEEVKEVSMLGNGKALITIIEPITGKDFTRINNIFLP